MRLQHRFVWAYAIVALVLALLGAVLPAVRDARLSDRHSAVALAAQAQGWARLQDDGRARLRSMQAELAGSAGWAAAWRKADREALLKVADGVLRGRDGLQVDLYGPQGELLASTSTDVELTALLEPTQVLPVVRGELRSLDGLRVLAGDRPALVLAQPAPAEGAVVVALDLRARFGALADLMAPERPSAPAGPLVYLLSLRGHEQLGSGAAAYAELDLGAPPRDPAVSEVTDGKGRQWWRVSQPLPGLDGRPVGLLVTLEERSTAERAERTEDLLLALAALLLLLTMTALVLLWLRRTLEPVERGAAVLEQLADGNVGARMDDDDGARSDEVGRLARAIGRLRRELSSLQMLRDERMRVTRQQERIIREQLRELASSLDETSRQEIVMQLEGATGVGDDEQGHQLARLAAILGRLSGLVTSQQNRLLDLLREVRAAMETKALFASLQQELEIARQMQRAILPRTAPQTSAVEVGATMIPAREVGGDFYDYFLIDERHLAMVVADVSGKGVPAAFFMAIARTLLKSSALLLRDPALVMARLNDQLAADNEQAMFVTVFFGVLDLQTGELRYVNAGHNPPVHWSVRGAAALLPRGCNAAVGMMEGLQFRDGGLTLAPGDALVLYTDGITEAQNAGGDFFGEAALLEALGQAPDRALEWPAALLAAVERFEAGSPHADDITCVVLRYRGA